jgi:hypothetical protein
MMKNTLAFIGITLNESAFQPPFSSVWAARRTSPFAHQHYSHRSMAAAASPGNVTMGSIGGSG